MGIYGAMSVSSAPKKTTTQAPSFAGVGPSSSYSSYAPAPARANMDTGDPYVRPISSGGGGGVPAATSNTGTAPQIASLPNTAQRDPEMTSFLNQMRGRIGTSMAREGQVDPNLQTQINRLGQRLSTDTTQRAQDFAAQDIGARARAADAGLQEDLARRGIRSDTGVAAELGTRVREKAMQEAARSAAGIALGREAQLDQLVLGGQGIMAAPGQMALAREGMTNDLMGVGFNQAGAIAGQNLADRTLGVNQWAEQNRFNLGAAGLAQSGKDNEIARLIALTRMGGY